ncbi:MAG: hypothetical protein EZS28_054116, partial [Streblomastix strix]
TRRPPRKVDVNGRVVPIATAERPLIPRQKDAIRPSGPSCDYKIHKYDLTVAINQSIEYPIVEHIEYTELFRSSLCSYVRGIVLAKSLSEIFAIYGYSGIRLKRLRSGNEHARIEVSDSEHNCV